MDRESSACESDLKRLSQFVQSRHEIGGVKHIGLREAVDAAINLIERHEFERHLDAASRAVAAWAPWKQSVLGAAAARSRQPVTLIDWLGGREIKSAEIVRQNGRSGPATRLDWPLLRIVAKQAVWQDYGRTCVFLNTYDPPQGAHGNAKPNKAWQMVVVTASKRKSNPPH